MDAGEKLITEFEKAIQPSIDKLTALARHAGEEAERQRALNPSIDTWRTPYGEMQHCINGALQAAMFASMGRFPAAGNALEKYIPRLEALERQTGMTERPSEIVADIRKQIDRAISAHPEMSHDGP